MLVLLVNRLCDLTHRNQLPSGTGGSGDTFSILVLVPIASPWKKLSAWGGDVGEVQSICRLRVSSCHSGHRFRAGWEHRAQLTDDSSENPSSASSSSHVSSTTDKPIL